MTKLNIPLSEEDIDELEVGDLVELSGTIMTGRDAAHKYIVDTFLDKQCPESERAMFEELKATLKDSLIYHCGPVVSKESGEWEFVAAGPTTSIREEPYEHRVIEEFNLRGVIGKGGMGSQTLEACRKHKAAYFHAIGGAAALIAGSVKEVIDVFKIEEFGLPEAFWKIKVEDFRTVVTMDAHGNSLHNTVEEQSGQAFKKMI